MPGWYCDYVGDNAIHREYHDHVYGFPLTSDDEFFERLTLEIFQAGLNWTVILQKLEGFRKAFKGFAVKKVAAFTDADVDRLLGDAGIIRNRKKIEATIHNAQVMRDLQKEYGSFAGWLDAQHPKELAEWVKLFKKTFKFTGEQIVNEFLLSTGYLGPCHAPECAVGKQIAKKKPAWMRK